MQPRVFLCLLMLAACPDTAAEERLYDAINRQRAGAGECAAGPQLPPMQPQAALEQAAQDVAQGRDLRQSLKQHGYRAARWRSLSVKGPDVVAQAAKALAGRRYCSLLQNPGLTQVGIHVDAGQLLWNATLAEAARLHVDDMARHDYIAHEGRDGSTPSQRIERTGYRFRRIAENLAGGGKMQAEDAVAGWIKSPGHCANLMNPAFTEMGAAYAVNPHSHLGIYWAQAFGAPR